MERTDVQHNHAVVAHMQNAERADALSAVQRHALTSASALIALRMTGTPNSYARSLR